MKTPRGRVGGCFYVRSPEMSDLGPTKLWPSGEGAYRAGVFGIAADSDVTRGVKAAANAGRSAAAGVVSGAWLCVGQVVQTRQTGSVA